MQDGGGDIERGRQLCCSTEVAQSEGKDRHGNKDKEDHAVTDQRRERRQGGSGEGAVIVPGATASFMLYTSGEINLSHKIRPPLLFKMVCCVQ